MIFLLVMTLLCASCVNDVYGPKVNKNDVEVYYKPDALKAEAQIFAELMDSLDYGKNGVVSFQLIRDSIININMVTQDAYHTDKSLDYALNAISLYVAMTIFEKERVQIHLTDDTFKRKRSLEIYEK